MIKRRELLQSLAGIAAVPLAKTLSVNGFTKAAVAAIPPGHYMLFADPANVDLDTFAQMDPLPQGITMDLIAVHLRTGQSIGEVVKIYKIDAEEKP
jgi:hypothetical protein